ncbi:DUF945 family protein [Janthinobacterium sp. Mn2066]|uniref:DUF945 family protein n=1 Tax=Janthinobacterium sp. Mn2066 TaxID=3395264 RepID=UPI003BC0E5B4
MLLVTYASATPVLQPGTIPAQTPSPGAVAAASASPQPGKFMTLWLAVFKELRDKAGPQENWAHVLESPLSFTPETTAQLKAVFGTEQPVHTERTQLPGGATSYVATLSALDALDSDGARIRFPAATLRMRVSANKQNIVMNGNWPALTMTSGPQISTLLLRDMRFDSNFTTHKNGVSYGSTSNSMGSALISPRNGGPVLFSDVRYINDIVKTGKLDEMRYRLNIGSIQAGGKQIDQFKLGLRLTSLDLASVAEMTKAVAQSEGVTPQTMDPEHVSSIIRHVGIEVFRKGGTFILDDLSASFRGYRAAVKGRLSFKGLSADDFANPAAIVQKVLLKLDVRVPVPLIHAIGEEVAAEVAARQQTKDVMPAGKVIDETLAKLVKEGYLRIDKGVVLATLVMQDAKLTVGGKPLQLSPQATAVKDQAQPENLPAQ